MQRYKVDLPSLFFVALTGVIILLSAVALRFNQSKYLLESLSPGILTSAFSEEQAEVFQEDSIEAMQEAVTKSNPDKQILDVATFGMWFLFGILAYYLCYGFYATFIHPFSADINESHYVHGNAGFLVKKRLLWFIAVAFTGLLMYGVYSVYSTIVLTYYMVSIYEPGVINGLMLFGSIALTSLLVAAVRLGFRVVIRAY